MRHLEILGLAASLTGLLLFSAPPPAIAGGPSSTYTKFDLKKCGIFRKDEESGSASWLCPGYANETMYFAEDDLRTFVSFGAAAEAQVAAEQTLPPFNHVNDTLEWRLGADGKPFATILRWFTDLGDGSEGQVLVVTKIGLDGVCHIAYVDALANKNANELARQAADLLSAGFDCETQQPVTFGTVGRSLG